MYIALTYVFFRMRYRRRVEVIGNYTLEVFEEVIVIEELKWIFWGISRCGKVLRLRLEGRGMDEERTLEIFT